MQQLDWRSLYPHVDPKLVSESIQSIAAAQMDSVKKVVPWYLENMPVSQHSACRAHPMIVNDILTPLPCALF
jgi:hypothetical protein